MEERSLTPSNPQSTKEKIIGVLLDPIGDYVESDCDHAVVEIDGKDSVEDSEGDREDCEVDEAEEDSEAEYSEEEDSEAEEDFEAEEDSEEEDDEEVSEDSEDSEGGKYFTEEEKEILRRRPKVKKPEWGYDSFQDREYDSSNIIESGDEAYDKKFRLYHRKVIETKGFFELYDDYPDYLCGGVCLITNLEEPNGKGINAKEFCSKLTSLCLERYNHEEVNFVAGLVAKLYITFAAKVSECLDAPLKDYQAKATWSLSGKSYPMFCRPAPPPQNVSVNALEDRRDELNRGGTLVPREF